MNIENSIKLYNEAVNLMPGGVNSPVRAFRSVGGNPIFIKKGIGSHIVDEDDNEYIDYCMSWGPLILGHSDRDVMDSILVALNNGTSFGTPNRYEVEIAEMVIDRYPSIEKIRFVNSGTEATMSAIRLARGYTGKEKFIKFDGCYHGHADHLLVAGGSGLATFGIPDSSGVTKNNVKDTIILPYNDIDMLHDVMKRESDNIAAIIMEPVPCNYGLIPPKENYLKEVRDLCNKYAILLIFDEVINGFRLSRGGAQEYFDIKADITTLGKIIGGGLPVGAYGASREIMANVAPEGPVYQAGTLSGNPLAMAAGIATLDKLEKTNAYKLLNDKSQSFKRLLEPALNKFAGRVIFLQIESIFAIYFTKRMDISSVSEVKESNMDLFAKFHREMLNRRVYISPSGYEVGFLSTSHTDEDLERTAEAISESLEAIL
ncbi:MAG: glutamate-1-semialdehyde 2,1-aminomutase [Spirochaetota bacterium]|nr:glutamate-1-semialdehyde 2,1-aminomutase [Spirochaetota bacterium]